MTHCRDKFWENDGAEDTIVVPEQPAIAVYEGG